MADALGDAESLTAFVAPDTTNLLSAPEIALSLSPYQSIGFFYKRGAEAFGFSGREACGYLMALSGCADGGEQAEWVRERLFDPPDGIPSFDTLEFDPFRGSGETAGRCFAQELKEPLGLVLEDADFLLRAKQANTIQTITEDYLDRVLGQLISTHVPKTLFLSGGVMLHCVALGKLAEAFPEVELVPCAVKKDSGTAVGAGVLAEVARVGMLAFESPRDRADGGVRRSLRLGTTITGSEKEWTHPPKGHSGSYEVFSSTEALVSALADDIASGTFVALVDGAGEFGPRALGARSVIALASSPTLSAHINEHIKQRFSFQPFTGAFLEEEFRRLHPRVVADRYMSYAGRRFNGGHPAPGWLFTGPARPTPRGLDPPQASAGAGQQSRAWSRLEYITERAGRAHRPHACRRDDDLCPARHRTDLHPRRKVDAVSVTINIGGFLETDSEGWPVHPGAGRSLQDEWRPALEKVAATCRSESGGRFHSFYVRGSVACGTAVRGSSDLDTVLLVDDDLGERRPDWQYPLEADVLAESPFITDVEVVVLGRGALLAATADSASAGPVMAQWCFC